MNKVYTKFEDWVEGECGRDDGDFEKSLMKIGWEARQPDYDAIRTALNIAVGACDNYRNEIEELKKQLKDLEEKVSDIKIFSIRKIE